MLADRQRSSPTPITEYVAARAYRHLSEKDKAVIQRQQRLLVSGTNLTFPSALAVVAAVGVWLTKDGQQ